MGAVGDPYVVYERWQNPAALVAYQNPAHAAALRKGINDSRTGPRQAEILLPVSE
jgi:quinol monooxygenase YgiN